MDEPSPDLYAILQVDRAAGREEIRRAYRRLLRSIHPDLHPSAGDTGDRVVRLRAVLEAYAVLGDPKRRADYDRAASRVSRTRAAPDPFLVGWSSRTAGERAWLIREPPVDLDELIDYLLRGRFPW